MRVLATCISCVVAATDCEADHVSALQHNAVASAQTKMHQRASSDGKLGSLEAVVAGKGPLKCDREQAAEMVSCFRVGQVSALDIFTKHTSIADAFADIAGADEDTCRNLKEDLYCLQKNPCYKRELCKLPYKYFGKKMSWWCKANKDVPVLDGVPDLTWGMLGTQPTNQILCQAASVVPEVKNLFDGCKVDCEKPGFEGTHHEWAAGRLPPDTTYSVQEGTKPCEEGHVVENMKDCRTASWNYLKLSGGFEKITKSHRPHGCYVWRNKGHWNSIGETKEQRGRRPICMVKRGTAAIP